MIYKTLQKVSNVCQVLDKSKYNPSQTINGVTFTNNGDGTITVNGTASADAIFSIQNIGTNRVPYVNITLSSSNLMVIKDNVLFEYSSYSPSNGWCYFFIPKGGVVENLVAKPQLFDLTEMYGAGNEPTTVEQFRQDFPEEMYDYSPHCFVKSYKDCLTCKTKNLFDISKVTQSNSIQSNDKDITCSVYGGSIGLLKDLCPSLKVGDVVTLSLKVKSTTGVAPTFVQIQGQILNYAIGAGSVTFTVTEEGLNSKFYLYNTTYENISVPTTTVFTDIMIELGDTATDYVPYGHLTSYKKSLMCKTKNLLPYPYFDGTKTFNGITYTDNGDGTVNLSGTSTSQSNYYFSYKTLNLKKGVTYTLSASGDYSCSGSFTFYIYNSTYSVVCYIPLASSNSASFTPTQDINGINCYIVIPPDRTLNGTFKPMMELGNTATDYVPYGHL